MLQQDVKKQSYIVAYAAAWFVAWCIIMNTFPQPVERTLQVGHFSTVNPKPLNPRPQKQVKQETARVAGACSRMYEQKASEAFDALLMQPLGRS